MQNLYTGFIFCQIMAFKPEAKIFIFRNYTPWPKNTTRHQSLLKQEIRKSNYNVI
jgi:hypothetical protein